MKRSTNKSNLRKYPQKYRMIIYERITPSTKMHYLIFWALVGVIYFLAQELAIQWLDEPDVVPFRMVIVLGSIVGFPVAGIFASHDFSNTINKLEAIVKVPINDYQQWLDFEFSNLFHYKTSAMKMIVFVLVLCGDLSVIITGLPYSSTLLNIFYIISLQPFIIIGSHAFYTVLALLLFLHRLVRYPFSVPFYVSYHPAIKEVLRFYSRSTLITLTVFLWLVLCISQASWISLNTIPAMWLTIYGFFPLATFLWSFFQIHTLLQTIKQQHIHLINNQIQAILAKQQAAPAKENVEQLHQLLEIQEKVEKRQEWPVNIGSLSTIFIAFVIPTLNIILNAFALFKF